MVRFPYNIFDYFIKELLRETSIISCVIINYIVKESLTFIRITKYEFLIFFLFYFSFFIKFINKIILKAILIIRCSAVCSCPFKHISLHSFKLLLLFSIFLAIIIFSLLSICIFTLFAPFLYSKYIVRLK